MKVCRSLFRGGSPNTKIGQKKSSVDSFQSRVKRCDLSSVNHWTTHFLSSEPTNIQHRYCIYWWTWWTLPFLHSPSNHHGPAPVAPPESLSAWDAAIPRAPGCVCAAAPSGELLPPRWRTQWPWINLTKWVNIRDLTIWVTIIIFFGLGQH